MFSNPPVDNATLLRFPHITQAGQRLLQHLSEHPHAPRYTHLGYDRVTPAGLRRAHAFANDLKLNPPQWSPTQPPAWVQEFVATCYRTVPLYRRAGPPPARWADVPTCDRADLNREPWAFVPDDQPLDNLIVYNTSGTTGHPLSILTHPDGLVLYLPLLQAALNLYGLTLEGGPERVSVALACYQQTTYTYAAVSAWLGQSGFIKFNLHPSEWREANDCARFLNDIQPAVFTGDPLAFRALAAVPNLNVRPQALVSTAMTLTEGLAHTLQDRFGCPVLDMYSLNEAGPVAVRVAEGWRLLQPRLYVEILNAAGEACGPDERGEVTLTGGFNPFLPLLRYRTGDYAALNFSAGQPQLVGLEGRAPVLFRAADGSLINNVDVSNALRPYPLTQYQLHQFADGALRLRVSAPAGDEIVLRAALLALFGTSQVLTLEVITAWPTEGKPLQYTSEWRE